MRPSKILSDLVASAIGAKTHYDIWWTQASEGRRRLVAARNRHSDFFNASRDAHFVAYFIYFAQLFDRTKGTSSIEQYLRLNKPNFEPKQFAELLDRHSALAKRAKPLLKIRHFRVAHVNATLSEDDVYKPLRITWNEIRDTIHDSAKFVAELAGASHVGEVGIPRDGRMEEATTLVLLALEPKP